MSNSSARRLNSDAAKQAFGERLSEAARLAGREYYGMYSELARHMGMTPRGVQKWFLGETIPGSPRIEGLARWYSVRPEWLRSGRGPARATVGFKPDEEPERILVHRVPIIAASELSEFTNGNLPPKVETIVFTGPLSPISFAFKVQDDSLIPHATRGMYLIVDYERTPKIGDLAVVITNDYFVAGYLINRGQCTLEAPNSRCYLPVEVGVAPTTAGTIVAVAQHSIGGVKADS